MVSVLWADGRSHRHKHLTAIHRTFITTKHICLAVCMGKSWSTGSGMTSQNSTQMQSRLLQYHVIRRRQPICGRAQHDRIISLHSVPCYAFRFYRRPQCCPLSGQSCSWVHFSWPDPPTFLARPNPSNRMQNARKSRISRLNYYSLLFLRISTLVSTLVQSSFYWRQKVSIQLSYQWFWNLWLIYYGNPAVFRLSIVHISFYFRGVINDTNWSSKCRHQSLENELHNIKPTEFNFSLSVGTVQVPRKVQYPPHGLYSWISKLRLLFFLQIAPFYFIPRQQCTDEWYSTSHSKSRDLSPMLTIVHRLFTRGSVSEPNNCDSILVEKWHNEFMGNSTSSYLQTSSKHWI